MPKTGPSLNFLRARFPNLKVIQNEDIASFINIDDSFGSKQIYTLVDIETRPRVLQKPIGSYATAKQNK